MTAYSEWRTLRELDLRAGRAKGAAFRAFKRIAPRYAEGRDYLVLQAPQDRAAIDELRAQGRIYAGSVTAVLLGSALARNVTQALRDDAPDPR